jgi:hypothetical protein
MINSTQPAEEHLGNQLTFVQSRDGTVHVPLKSLCEFLGIDYDRQRSKVRNSKQLKAELMPVRGTDGRHRKALCLPLAAIGDWASTIDPNTVQPEALEKLRGYLEEADEVSEGPENQGATADPEMAEITTEENRKKLAFNCIGSLNWFLDGFLLWASEVADNDGDYFPRDEEIIKASPEEIREYVRKVRCNIRVVQAIIDASIFYEDMDNPLDKQELIDFYNESLKLYRSTEELMHGGRSGKAGHSYLDYLCGPRLNAMAEFGVEFYADFQEEIIPRKKAG